MNNILNSEKEIEEEIKKLQKKYQDVPDILLKDYDDIIKNSLIGVIANFNTVGVLRDDIISQIDILIRNREFIINYYGNDSSCKH